MTMKNLITSESIQGYLESLPKDSKYSVITNNMIEKLLAWNISDSVEGILNRTLQGYFILSGSLQAILLEKDQIVYQFGLSLIPPDKLMEYYILLERKPSREPIYYNTTSVSGLPFDLYFQVTKEGSCIMFVVPQGYIMDMEKLEPIQSVLYNYYHFTYNQLPDSPVLLFSKFKKSFFKKINQLKEKGYTSLVISRVRFQDIKPYYSTIAQDNTQYIMQFLKDELEKRIEPDDLVYWITQREVIILSTSPSIDLNKKKLGDIFFQYKYIIINYKMYHHYLELSNPIEAGFIEKVFNDVI
jgi:hypothetical protein